jgi:hypothetical protein
MAEYNSGSAVPSEDQWQPSCGCEERRLKGGERFPDCDQHGETKWKMVTPWNWQPIYDGSR